MLWQQVIVLQIIARSITTLWSRKLTIWHPKAVFSTSVIMYAVVATTGLCLSLINNNGSLPVFTNPTVFWYLLGEGILIPISWIAQYRLLAHVGASSAVVAQTLNYVTVALFGFVFLGDPVSMAIVVGGLLLISGVVLALSIKKPSVNQTDTVPINRKILLIAISSLSLAGGLVFEKLAIEALGVWSYSFYGWTMQFIGAVVLFCLFGRQELTLFKPKFVFGAIVAGLLMSLAGSLFIYSLSKGLLSATILTATANIAITSVLAMWLLKERNEIVKRIIAVLLSIGGLAIVFL